MRPPASRNKRLVIAIAFAIVIAAIFWSQSRVPALNEKAQMGLRTNFSSIAFDIVLPVSDDQPAIERIARSTVNWLYTNWKGMTFGLLFAAAALTILSFVRHRSFSRPWMNTISGMFIGAPLGVCVNCATPIAQGMYAAGARLETALATLVSSPTLNVIVLSMSFTLLPLEVALGSVLAVLLFLASMPILVNRFATEAPARIPGEEDIARVARISAPPTADSFDEGGYLAALVSTSRHYLRNLYYIVKLAVPLMLLAGALGALVIELAPFDRLSNIAPTVPVLLITAVVATFLPVPMAFNVVVVMALLSNGMHPGIGAVLLFALSAYSIYPATVIARFISPRLSVAMAVTVIIIATGLGAGTGSYFDQKMASDQDVITAGLAEGKRNSFQDVLNVCGTLPEALQVRCFAVQIPNLTILVPYAEICVDRPPSVDRQTCEQMVKMIAGREEALASSSSEPCLALQQNEGRSECLRSFALQTALKNHDVTECESLSPAVEVQRCRVQYLNSSLLFNPDDSVCADLEGSDRFDCQVNARIYRIADTMDIGACDTLPANAQAHCRLVTASTMVGRSNDTSGCELLASPQPRLRCEEQVIAWEAARTGSLNLCRQLQSERLDENCMLRVADRQISTILTNYSLNLLPDPVPGAVGSGRTTSATSTAIAPPLDWSLTVEDESVTISYIDNRDRNAVNTQTLFSRASADDFGISKYWNFRITDFFEPFIVGKGIASGDIDSDPWPDLVLATERGAAIYKNTGGRFQLVDIDQGELGTENLFLVALVDADGDGRDDLFATAYGGQNFLLMNLADGFSQSRLIPLDSNQRLTMSAGFADLDQDDDLDIVLGNWSSGAEKLFSADQSENVLMRRDGDAYVSQQSGDARGETNSVLLTDINDDHRPDLLFGNDRLVPDLWYLSNADRQMQLLGNDQTMVPVTSMFTMSLDAADFDNDLKPDLFSTDMTFARSSNDSYCSAITSDDAQARCDTVLQGFEVFTSGDAAECSELESQADRNDCFIAFSVKAAKTLKDSRYCENLPDQSGALHSLCEHIAGPVPPEQRINQNDYIQQAQRNVLLMNDGTSFTDRSQEYGVDSSFWSWNAKAADLDNDGWQDIYIGNGFHFGDSFYEVQPNIMYRNLEGAGFEEIAESWGLADTINTPSYTYTDFDLDGDIDIIATGVLSPPRVFLNQQSENNSITFRLEQDGGNSDAIGATITIFYGGNNELQQRKEIRMSGGFLSFDNAVAHFGIGVHSEIDRATVTWPDGVATNFDAPLIANRQYRIRRK